LYCIVLLVISLLPYHRLDQMGISSPFTKMPPLKNLKSCNKWVCRVCVVTSEFAECVFNVEAAKNCVGCNRERED
jgi:hypothetical protein